VSVIMTMWVRGDPSKLEEYAAANSDEMRSVADIAKRHGVIAHRFYGSEGQIMIIDEWPDEQSFQSFFAETRSRMEPIMQAVGAAGEPGVNFWRKLESHDEVGWES
jgi:hypothetical protein